MLKQKLSNQFFSSDEQQNKQYSELLSDSGSATHHKRDFPKKGNNRPSKNMNKYQSRNKDSEKQSEEERQRVQMQIQKDQKGGHKFSSEIIPGEKYPKDSNLRMKDNKGRNQNNILFYYGGYDKNEEQKNGSIFEEDQELNMDRQRKKIKNNCLKTKYSYNQEVSHQDGQKASTNRYKDILRSAHSSKIDQNKPKNQEGKKIGFCMNRKPEACQQGQARMQELSKIEPSNYYHNMTSFNFSLTMNSDSRLGNSIVNTFEKMNKLCLQKQDKQKEMLVQKQAKKRGKGIKQSDSEDRESRSQSSDSQTLVQHSQQLLDMTKIMNESMVVNITPKRKHEIYQIEQQESDWQSVSEDRNNQKKEIKKQVKTSKLQIKNEVKHAIQNKQIKAMKKTGPYSKYTNSNFSRANGEIYKKMQQQSTKQTEVGGNLRVKQNNFFGKQKKVQEGKEAFLKIGMYVRDRLNQETISQFEQNFIKYYPSKPAFHKAPRIKMLDFLSQLCQLITIAKNLGSKKGSGQCENLFTLGVQISNNFEEDKLLSLKQICTKYYNGSYFEVGPKREVFKQIKTVIQLSKKFL